MKYNEMKTKQQEFIQWLFDDNNHDEDSTTFQRGYLKRIANDNGMAWAPAWIVKDTTRVSKRGFYNVPELADFICNHTGIDFGKKTETEEEDVLIERMQNEAASESESLLEATPVESSAQTVAV